MICNSCSVFYEGKTTRCLTCLIEKKFITKPLTEKVNVIQTRSQRRLEAKEKLVKQEAAKRSIKRASCRVKCPRCRSRVRFGYMNTHYEERHPTVSLLEPAEKIKKNIWVQVFSGGLPGLGKRH